MTLRNKRWPLYVAGAACVGTALAFARRMGKRRTLLRLGQIRELQSSWYKVGGLRLHARTGGESSAPAIVLIPGWGMSCSYLVPLAERLASRFRVYALDLPGRGNSSAPNQPPTIAAHTSALLDWIDAAGIDRPVLLGHSFGAQIAVNAALESPERIDSLILICLTPDPSARSMGRQFLRFLSAIPFDRPSLIPLLVRDYVRMAPRLKPEFDAMLFDPIEHNLALVSLPSILVRGQHDPMVPQIWFDTAARLLRTDSTIIIPWWGHGVPYSDPEGVANAVANALLRRLTAQR